MSINSVFCWFWHNYRKIKSVIFLASLDFDLERRGYTIAICIISWDMHAKISFILLASVIYFFFNFNMWLFLRKYFLYIIETQLFLQAPVLFRGIGHSINPANSLVMLSIYIPVTFFASSNSNIDIVLLIYHIFRHTFSGLSSRYLCHFAGFESFICLSFSIFS